MTPLSVTGLRAKERPVSPPRSGRAGGRSPRRKPVPRGGSGGGRERKASVRGSLTGEAYLVLGTALAMSLFGMVMIFSASSGMAFAAHGSSYYYLVRQAAWFGVGLAALAALAWMDYRRVAEISSALLLVSLAALAAVLITGSSVYGSRRAINLGSVVFQPSELAKVSLLLFSAYALGKRRSRPREWREILFPVLLAAGVVCLLILAEPDLGTAFLCAATVFCILFLAGAPLHRLLVLAVGGVGVGALCVLTAGYRKARFLAFLDPWSAPQEGGFQVIQSMVALGSGSMTGLGLGMSRQKFFYLPNAHTDFIFSIIGEELGLVGTLAVLGLFAVLLWACFRIAVKAPDRTSALIAGGAGCMMGIQALVNMGGATGLLPITGVTLPFISYGGSSLVMSLALTGVLINISRWEERSHAAGGKGVENRVVRRRHRGTPASPAGLGRGAGAA